MPALFNSRAILLTLITTVTFLLTACDKPNAKNKVIAQNDNQQKIDTDEQIKALDYIAHNETYNFEAPIPAQCYTKTEGKHNPCYVCHQSYSEKDRPNKMNDGFQQGSYAFSEVGESNSWKNLFKDRRKLISEISDDFILDYVRQDNYQALVGWMKTDAWQGEILELNNLGEGANAFDDHGLALDGSRWVAFNYKPLPSTFWPTNGSTDDTFIRLARHFTEKDGQFSKDVYYANLAILEMNMSGLDSITTVPLNEARIGKDLNDNGTLDSNISYIEAQTHYVGDASETETQYMLYPEGTAFLHTVRYIDVNDAGEISPAKRMKEVRYMVKRAFVSKERLKNRYYNEFKEKHFENLPNAVDKHHNGTSNGFGWSLIGFIENEHGVLRKQHREEQFACIGCHKTVGTTIDQTFSFPRKVAGAEGWGYIDLKKIKDVPNVGETEGEFLTYLERVGGGDEFRQNTEMLKRWFDEHGEVNREKVESLNNIYELITPSPKRALQLNKAYYTIVREQSFLFGRDVVIAPAHNVFKEIDVSTAPLEPEFRYQWDIRLNWDASKQLPTSLVSK